MESGCGGFSIRYESRPMSTGNNVVIAAMPDRLDLKGLAEALKVALGRGCCFVAKQDAWIIQCDMLGLQGTVYKKHMTDNVIETGCRRFTIDLIGVVVLNVLMLQLMSIFGTELGLASTIWHQPFVVGGNFSITWVPQ